MDRSDFIASLALYGSDIGRWPEEIREGAYAAAGGSAELRALVDEERRFEATLDTLPFEDAGPGLAGRIITAAGARRAQAPAPLDVADRPADLGLFFTELFLRLFTLRPAIALTLALIIGVALGYGDPTFNGPGDPVDIGSFLFNGEDLP